jgi:hypothetical protein
VTPEQDNFSRMKNNTNGNARIDLLKKRRAEIDQRLSAELAKSRQRDERENARAATVVGKHAIEMAAQNAAFGLMLKQVLDDSVIDDRERDLLRRKGLL